MKRLILIVTIIALNIGALRAQSPDMFNYQAVARNDQGEIIANQNVGIKISVRQGSPNGTIVYAEEHNASTNNNGLVNMMVGNGAALSGSFTNIVWGEGTYFIEVAMDETGGTNYSVMGTTQLVSVPYAKYADSSGNAFTGNYNDLNNTPELGRYVDTSMVARWDKDSTDDFSGDYGDLSNKPDLSDTASYDDYWKNKDDTIFYDKGKVGIGTDSITGNLTVQGSGQTVNMELIDDNSTLDINATDGNAGINFSMDGVPDGSIWYDKTSDFLAIQNETGILPGTDNIDMLISNKDNVGINTTNPKERLDVNGAIRVRDTTTNPKPNRIYGNSTPLAYGEIDKDGTIMEGAYGIDSVDLYQTGVYDIYFSKNIQYHKGVSVTTKNKTIANYGYAHATDHELLVIEILDLSGNQTNDRFSIIVFGARPPESNQ